MKQKKESEQKMRELTETEVSFTKKNLLRLEDDRQYLLYLQEMAQLMLDEGISSELVRQEKESREKLETAEEGSYDHKRLTILLDKGLVLGVKRKILEYKNNLRELKQQLNTLDFQEQSALEQIKNGVPLTNGFRETKPRGKK